jgi:hypothetical protein
MRQRRLQGIVGIMMMLCLGLAWAGLPVQGAPPVRPPKEVPAQFITTTPGLANVTPTRVPTSSAPLPMPPPPNHPVYYSNFFNRGGLFSVGPVSVNDYGQLHLQDAYNSNVPGAIWTAARHNISDGFETRFKFRLSRHIGPGADGFAFVLQNSGMNATGNGGCAIGYGGIDNSLIIEFDTYTNSYITAECGGVGDPNDNHIGLLRNGVPNHGPDTPAVVLNNIWMEDSNVHSVKITYVTTTQTLTVHMDDSLVASFQTSLEGLGMDDGWAWVGFTAGQGGARQDVDIWGWSFTRPMQTQTCQVDMLNVTVPIYRSALDALNNTNAILNTSNNTPLDLNGIAGILVNQRSLLRDDIVRGVYSPFGTSFPPEFWFRANGNTVARATNGFNCDDIFIEDALVPPSLGLQQAGIIDQLKKDYGVQIIADAAGTIWSNFEVREIYRSVVNIANSFRAVSGQPSTVQPNVIFSMVFGSASPTYKFILLVRTNSDSPTVTFYNGTQTTPITGTYPLDSSRGICRTVEAGNYGVTLPSAIICRDDLANDPPASITLTGTPASDQLLSPVVKKASQHTITHEFGHIFDYLTRYNHHINPPGPVPTVATLGFVTNYINDEYLPNGATLSVGEFVLMGCNNTIVMGYVQAFNVWRRGTRGWGSAPPLSMYLQNGDQLVALEAAADLFLNWVYRVNLTTALNRVSTPVPGLPVPGLGNTYIQNYSINGAPAAPPGCQLGNYGPTISVDGGFYNIAPLDNQSALAAPPDAAYSGDIRQALMNDIVTAIFNLNGW